MIIMGENKIGKGKNPTFVGKRNNSNFRTTFNRASKNKMIKDKMVRNEPQHKNKIMNKKWKLRGHKPNGKIKGKNTTTKKNEWKRTRKGNQNLTKYKDVKGWDGRRKEGMEFSKRPLIMSGGAGFTSGQLLKFVVLFSNNLVHTFKSLYHTPYWKEKNINLCVCKKNSEKWNIQILCPFCAPLRTIVVLLGHRLSRLSIGGVGLLGLRGGSA